MAPHHQSKMVLLLWLIFLSNGTYAFSKFSTRIKSTLQVTPRAMTSTLIRSARETVPSTEAFSSLGRRTFVMASFSSVFLSISEVRADSLRSDEYIVEVNDGPIGITLDDVSRYVNQLRVVVKMVEPNSPAGNSGLVRPGHILVSVNGKSLEYASAKAVQEIIAAEHRPLRLVLRDPTAFTNSLMPSSPQPLTVVSTEVAPSPIDGSASEQVIRVEREINVPCGQGALVGDLLEISYIGRLTNGTVFDGSTVTVNGASIPGRAGDSTIYFVLGQQPTGQFPPGWDVGLVGMCIGEKRTLTVPAVLAYGSKVKVPHNRLYLNSTKIDQLINRHEWARLILNVASRVCPGGEFRPTPTSSTASTSFRSTGMLDRSDTY